MESPTPDQSPERAAWAASADELLAALGVTDDQGLGPAQVTERLARYGPNRLRVRRPKSPWRTLADQFLSLVVALLVGAAAVAFLYDEQVEGLAILAVVLINAAIGFGTERRALSSMEALRALGQTSARVRRGGVVQSLPAEQLVPGDRVLLEAGDVLTADLRLVQASQLELDESALTGESLPVAKGPAPVPQETPLAERTSMAFKGTSVARGTAEGVVVSTGMATELGTITALVDEAESEATPLEHQLDRLAQRLVLLVLLLAAAVTVAGVSTGRDLAFALQVGLALAVAAIPEGLPIVATLALARGLWRMAQRNALVERLSAVETLGSTGLILTDKTGTLTENRMTAVDGILAAGEARLAGDQAPDMNPDLEELLRAAVLCNNASPGEGDPTETALLGAGARAGLTREGLESAWPRRREVPFDSTTKRMATVHEAQGRLVAYLKGAPEALVPLARAERREGGEAALDEAGRAAWLGRAQDLAARGQRVLALATRDLDDLDQDPAQELTLLGLVGLEDPPRAGVAEAIAACRQAGIRVVMVTGDHGATGWKIAGAVGIAPEGEPDGTLVEAATIPDFAAAQGAQREALLAARVVARATPKQKLDLMRLHQAQGTVVAMTGDGVNDAPALQQADIGVAMGLRGTQVARQAADMVLQDDEFGTIVAAIAQGRAIFANIRKFVVYLMSCNVSEVLAVTLGVLAQGPLPVLPLQILFLNLVTDIFPALALGVGEGSPALVGQPPRDPRQPILARRHWGRIFLWGSILSGCVLASLYLAVGWLGLPEAEATTVAFLTLALAQLLHVFTLRDRRSGWLRNEVTTNPYVWGALALCLALLLAAVYWSPLSAVMDTTPPSAQGWGLVAAASLASLALGQMTLLGRRRS